VRKLMLFFLIFISACAIQPELVTDQSSAPPKATCSKTAAAELIRLQPVSGTLYRDSDEAAKVRVTIVSEKQLSDLVRLMDKPTISASNARVMATRYSVLAYQFALQGDCLKLEDYYQRALATNGDPSHAAWSNGWSKIAVLDYVGAVNVWAKSVPQPNGKPFWLAYSLAVAFQGAGEHELARAWWRAAVISNPALATKQDALRYFDHWRENEKTLLRQLIEQS